MPPPLPPGRRSEPRPLSELLSSAFSRYELSGFVLLRSTRSGCPHNGPAYSRLLPCCQCICGPFRGVRLALAPFSGRVAGYPSASILLGCRLGLLHHLAARREEGIHPLHRGIMLGVLLVPVRRGLHQRGDVLTAGAFAVRSLVLAHLGSHR